MVKEVEDMILTPVRIYVVLALFGGTMAKGTEVPVLTVCEALQSRITYNAKLVVLVGRLGSTFEGSWLSEDCEQKLTTEGYTWPNIISMTYIRSETQPPKLPDDFKWNKSALAEKLARVQKTTKLRQNGKDHWIAVCGRFETRETFRVGRTATGWLADGFGHLNGAPAQLISAETEAAVYKFVVDR
jgi:hypothetical protein